MKKIYLIDANSFIYRMFYGVPEFITKKGEYVNAVFGIARFFMEQLVRENPDYVIFVKDAKGKNFRHDLDENYKATRDRMPDNLRSQMPIINDMVKKMGVPIIEIEGYEADDVIGTLAHKYNGSTECEVDVLTGDKDLYSLVSKNVYIYDTMKKKKFGPEETVEKFGVKPESIIDYLSIVGDKADNIPGIDGFGPKKAVELINIVGTVETIYNFVDDNNLVDISEKEVKALLITEFGEDKTKNIFGCFKGKTFEKLLNSREDAFLSKKLATIELNVELEDFDLEKYKFTPDYFLNDSTIEMFRELEFNSLLNEEAPELQRWDDLNLKVRLVDSDIGLEKLLKNIGNYKQITFDTETTGLDIMTAELVGISIYLNDDNIFYINRMHSGNSVSDPILKDFLINLFKLDILIIGHNIKYDLEIIELYLKSDKSNENTSGQMTLEI